ncbi:methionine ABC transporter permease [Bacillus chungangensis]|uniref:D-methionine transport system permease protein n=1 Tax=Bacillus chungangensis TaxID=587633 RepID=A0ABT9WU69_9BACI|nr:methionine ABC transporter permease [Bacillus chungangensis]MDQ0176765.1 D-methionine transport system permease protein [Bacillus chungangensis]
MFENVIPLLPEIGIALWQTLLMVTIAVGFGVLGGTPLGIVLFMTNNGQTRKQALLSSVTNGIVNIVRSFPFIILLVALIPFTRLLLGTTIGPIAAAVPMSIAAIFYFARLLEQTLRDVPKGVMEAAEAMGASTFQTVWKVLFVEARAGIVLNITVLTVSFISYSSMAGVVGGGGIGDLAIRFGYYRFQTDVMVSMIILLIVLVQLVQFIGNKIALYLDKR